MKRPILSAILLVTAVGFAISPSLSRAQTEPVSYPVNERISFINSCAYGRGSDVRAVCACTYDKIKERYTYEQYLTIRRQISEGQPLPEPVVMMIAACREAQAR